MRVAAYLQPIDIEDQTGGDVLGNGCGGFHHFLLGLRTAIPSGPQAAGQLSNGLASAPGATG
jgi:hypothetical protein